jgi:hypothetical protein
MRLVFSLLLGALVAAEVTRASDAPSPLQITLELAPATPRPGDRVFWLGRLQNTTRQTLFVPKQIRSWLTFGAHHQGPSTSTGMSGGVSRAMLRDPPPIEWIALAPGASLEEGGDVGAVEPRCSRGCPEGTLFAWFQLAPNLPPAIEGDANDRVVPGPMRASARAAVEKPRATTLEVRDPAALRITALGARTSGGTTIVRARFQNVSSMPLWVPKPERLVVNGCSFTTPDGVAGSQGTSYLHDEDSADGARHVLVRPGRALEGVLTCRGLAVQRGGSVTVSFATPWEHESLPMLDPPFLWAGGGVLGPVIVGR